MVSVFLWQTTGTNLFETNHHVGTDCERWSLFLDPGYLLSGVWPPDANSATMQILQASSLPASLDSFLPITYTLKDCIPKPNM